MGDFLDALVFIVCVSSLFLLWVALSDIEKKDNVISGLKAEIADCLGDR